MIILCSNGLTSPELLRAAGQHVKAGGRAAIVVTADPEYKEKNYHVGREQKRLELLSTILIPSQPELWQLMMWWSSTAATHTTCWIPSASIRGDRPCGRWPKEGC